VRLKNLKARDVLPTLALEFKGSLLLFREGKILVVNVWVLAPQLAKAHKPCI